MHFHSLPESRRGSRPLTRVAGPLGAIIVGLIASSITFAAGQIAFTTVRSPLIRAAIALLFAVPAAVAGYHAALGLAQIGIPAEGWRQAIAVIGAIAVAATAWARIVLIAPPDTGRASLPASPVRLSSAAHDGRNRRSSSKGWSRSGVSDRQSGTNSRGPSRFDTRQGRPRPTRPTNTRWLRAMRALSSLGQECCSRPSVRQSFFPSPTKP